ncbi:transporter substrate-binding domain-containing protein [Brevibacillus centrosporus]|jgi:polar amino acid transport system substrate-binding protein|uniref:transporter substrate-binding domain-containing protein n=1 Tax=Brevibacillus centrosporus TaxID=54910 RepID=UPI002E1B100E|nr:transporter substrate-binding domain-containing protein [Brevibacillus centrosporus]
MKKKAWIGALTSLLLTGMIIVGCGTSTTSSEPAAKTASQPSGQPGEQKEFVFAMSGIYKPFNYKENGKLTGFDVEIGEALAAKMGMKPVPITFPFETIVQGLIDKKFDAILGSMTITEERAKVINFTKPYYRSGSQIFVAEDNQTITSPDAVKGKKIGVAAATNYEKVAMTLTDKDKVMKYSSGDVSAMMDLGTKRVDAVISDQVFGYLAIKDGGLKVKPIGEPLVYDEQAIGVNKENTELLEKLNKALDEIIADGTYDKICEKWIGRNILGDPKK